MDVTTDLVSDTASKINFDKKFLVGVAVGASIVGAAALAGKLKNKIAAKRAENEDNDEL